MPQDAFTLLRAARALSGLLAGGKVNKIVQPRPDEVALTLYAAGRTRRLELSANAALPHALIRAENAPAPLVCPNFCMLLRKHLLGAELLSVELVGFERILLFTFLHRNELKVAREKRIYAELMGKYSNLFLVENGRILGSIKTATLEESSVRPMLTGMEYRLPPAQDKADPFDRADALARLAAFPGGDLGNFLFREIKGLAKDTAGAIAVWANGSASRPAFRPGEAEAFFDKLQFFLFDREAQPCVLLERGAPKDFFVFPYPEKGGTYEFFPSLTDAAAYCYEKKERAKSDAEKKRKLLSAASAYEKKQQKKLAIALEKRRAAENLEDDRVCGELITANIYRLKKGDERAALYDYYANKERAIALDKNLSPAENAQRYFKKYNKQKKTLEAVRPQIEEANAELEYAKALAAEIELAESDADFAEIARELRDAGILRSDAPAKKHTEELPSRERVYEVKGFTVRGGRNNLQNDRVTGRAKPEHLWLHVKNYHGCHVIIEGTGNYPDEVVRVAAEIAAYYSDGRTGDKIPVDYCLKKFVKKPPKAKSGQAFYTDFKTAFVTPDAHEELLKK